MGTKRLKKGKAPKMSKLTKSVEKTLDLKIVKKKKQVVDLTVDVDSDSSIDQKESSVKAEPDEAQFVIDKKTDAVVKAPFYEAVKRKRPTTLEEVLNGLRNEANLLPPMDVTKLDKNVLKLRENTAKKEKKRELKRLRSGIKSIQSNTSVSELFDVWSNSNEKAKKRYKINVKAHEEPALTLPMSYNPDVHSDSLRSVVKSAAQILSSNDKVQSRIERKAKEIRNAKQLTKQEEIAELAAGLYSLSDNDSHGDEVDGNESKAVVSGPTKRISKKDRRRRLKEERNRKAAAKRKEENRLLHDFYRLRAINKEVSEIAARRTALQSHDAQKLAAHRRKMSILNRIIQHKAIIKQRKVREASALIAQAPADLIGDANGGLIPGQSLRLIQPHSKYLLVDHLAAAQKRGILLDYRKGEEARRAQKHRKRHGYKTFSIDR